jgi:hypothetical protein
MPAPHVLSPEKVALVQFLPDGAQLGPAMAKLNQRMQLFVIACLDLGGVKNHTKAARFAGYAGDPLTLKVTGHRLAHDPNVQAALLEEAKKRIQASTVAAANLVEEVVSNPKYDVRDRLKAAMMILDRGGIHTMTEHRVDVNVNDSRAAQILEVTKLARQLGKDPRELLGTMVDVIEADFKVLERVEEKEAAADG